LDTDHLTVIQRQSQPLPILPLCSEKTPTPEKSTDVVFMETPRFSPV